MSRGLPCSASACMTFSWGWGTHVLSQALWHGHVGCTYLLAHSLLHSSSMHWEEPGACPLVLRAATGWDRADVICVAGGGWW